MVRRAAKPFGEALDFQPVVVDVRIPERLM